VLYLSHAAQNCNTESHKTTVVLRSNTSAKWCCVAGRVVPDVLNDRSASIFKGHAMLLARRIVTSAAHSYGYKTACSYSNAAGCQRMCGLTDTNYTILNKIVI